MYELWVNIPPAAPHYGCWMVGICSDTNHLTRSKLYLDQLPLSPFTWLVKVIKGFTSLLLMENYCAFLISNPFLSILSGVP